MTCADYLLGIFHQKLIPRFLEQARIRMHTLVQELSETQFKSLVQAVKRNVVLIDTTNGFDNAQVCAGGISTIELSARTMESRYIKGLYLTGELLDADGICGGYTDQSVKIKHCTYTIRSGTKDFENASYEKRISSGIQDQTPVH